MSRFTEQLMRDSKSVFLNPAEFGGSLLINGRAVTAMWDESAKPGGDGDAMYGIDVERRLLLALAADMDKPLPGQELEIEGVFWRVGPVQDSVGIYQVELSRNLS